MRHTNILSLFMVVGLLLASTTAIAGEKVREIGRNGTDWMGNDIVIEAIKDPQVEGVTCFLSRFDRSLLDRTVGMFKDKSPFVDPSDNSLSCRQTADEVKIGAIPANKKGEEIFNKGISLVFRDLHVVRFYDKTSHTLVYVSYSTRVTEGSAKSGVSVVPLYGAKVTWTAGTPK